MIMAPAVIQFSYMVRLNLIYNFQHSRLKPNVTALRMLQIWTRLIET